MRPTSLVLLIIITLTACEEVIQIDINDADPQIVIEANISDQTGWNYTYITKSTDFYNPNEYIKVTNAEIIISDDSGDKETLTEVEPGVYRTKSLIGQKGKSYSIETSLDGRVFYARTTIPETIKIDSVNYKLNNNFRNKNKESYEIHCYFTDPPGIKNYARLKIYKNGKQIDGIFVYDDRLTDGNRIDYSRFRFGDEDNKIELGDEVKIELMSIDEQTYNYFNTLSDVLASGGGGMGSVAPGNPTTNWQNGALGYFGGYSLDSITFTIYK
ncbi:MAG: hypothetical protein CVV23_12510 [Ignavibacteriae bacterium HGW-Ignavibacteriae-2]|jgi:hypothetical protein|nr:DUF4249 domain-containing protein [Bacteroidota bacterium]PKL87987.1 MAG: hypothetical protein CVV23_12510 [Ignavibacteriae bacterium HGW-Ignavibacteriae-2]